MKYRGVVKAMKGSLLLGGVPEVKSIWFKTYKDAELWLNTMEAGNENAGRKIEDAWVEERDAKTKKG